MVRIGNLAVNILYGQKNFRFQKSLDISEIEISFPSSINEVLAARKQLCQAPYYATALVVWSEAEPKHLAPGVSRFAP